MRKADALKALRAAYEGAGYQVQSLKLRWTFPFWVIDAAIEGEPFITTTGTSNSYGSWHEALTKRRLVRKVQAIYSARIDGSLHPAACGPGCRSQHTDDHSGCTLIDGTKCPFCGCMADAPVTCARPFHFDPAQRIHALNDDGGVS